MDGTRIHLLLLDGVEVVKVPRGLHQVTRSGGDGIHRDFKPGR
jgi:hypothetical protein